MYPRRILPDNFDMPMRLETDRFVLLPVTYERTTQDMEGIGIADLTRMTNDTYINKSHDNPGGESLGDGPGQ